MDSDNAVLKLAATGITTWAPKGRVFLYDAWTDQLSGRTFSLQGDGMSYAELSCDEQGFLAAHNWGSILANRILNLAEALAAALPPDPEEA